MIAYTSMYFWEEINFSTHSISGLQTMKSHWGGEDAVVIMKTFIMHGSILPHCIRRMYFTVGDWWEGDFNCLFFFLIFRVN